ncbi:hypothetical protein BD410DRAFT_702749, partial [Rickenella mellea]
LERNSAKLKDFIRQAPKPIVVEAEINGSSVRALLDSGSRADFMSSTLVDQLKIPVEALAKSQPVQLAVTGSRAMVNYSVTAEVKYNKIREQRRFDVLNVDGYDLILGTPFLFQHKILLGFNPFQVLVGSIPSLPIVGEGVTIISSRAADLAEPHLERLRRDLRSYASDICKDAIDTPLPPLRAVNHIIPLVDESKVYAWRPSKCPDALRPLWQAKREVYRKTGHWQFRSGSNAMPMLMLKKP